MLKRNKVHRKRLHLKNIEENEVCLGISRLKEPRYENMVLNLHKSHSYISIFRYFVSFVTFSFVLFYTYGKMLFIYIF